MKRQLVKFAVVVGLGAFLGQAYAVDLLGVYNQATTSDPTFKAAHSQWQSNRENIAISRAALLPQFTIGAGYGYSYVHTRRIDSHYSNRAGNYSLTLDQPIFNFQSWSKLKQSKSSVKGSAATFAASAQDLMLRSSTAYFNVLQAQDVLRYDRAEKLSIARQLERTKQRYNVGLIAITDVYQAQANYDSIAAQEIQDKNDLSNQKEKLREITGLHYKSFSSLGSRLPLLKPNPASIDSWVKVAKRQNYSLLAARFTALAAQENITSQSTGRLPTIDAEGKYVYTNNSKINAGARHSNVTTVGVNLNFPVLQGGLVSAQTRQAKFDYQKALADWEKTRRSAVSTTRQSYLGVLSYISKIRADRQAIISNRSALKATEAGYIVGTQTMVDVLNVQAELYNVQKSYAIDQYQYIIQTLALKQAAGTLSASDLMQINSWLQQPRRHTIYRKVVTSKKAKFVKKAMPYKRSVVAPKVVEKKVTPKPFVAPKATATQAPKAVQHTTINKQILDMNPDHFTIQILATGASTKAVEFMNKVNLNAKAYCYTAKENGKEWYKIIVGDFVSIERAQQTLKNLPPAVRKENPWIRKIVNVQKELM